MSALRLIIIVVVGCSAAIAARAVGEVHASGRGYPGCFVGSAAPLQAYRSRQLRRCRGPCSAGTAAFVDADSRHYVGGSGGDTGSSHAKPAYASRRLVCRLSGGGSGGSSGGGGGGSNARTHGRSGGHMERAWRRLSGGATRPQASFVGADAPTSAVQLQSDEAHARAAAAGFAAAGNASYAGFKPPRAALPDKTSSFLSRLTFGWAEPLLKIGNERVLQEADVWELPDERRMRNLTDAFEAAYSAECEKAELGSGGYGSGAAGGAAKRLPAALQAPLVRVMWQLHRRQFIVTGLLRLVNSLIQFLPAILLSRLLKTFEAMAAAGAACSGTAAGVALARAAYGSSFALFAVVTAKTLVENQYFYRMVNVGASIRGAVATAVYRKSLRLSPAARQKATVGEIVNYMQLDSGRIEQLAMSVHTLWDSVFQVVGYTALLLWLLGPSVLAGVGLMAALVPVNTLFYTRLSAYRAAVLRATDRRIRTVQEMLQGIRAIKLYNWESPFKERVQSIHDEELDTLLKSTGLRAALVSVLSMTPAVVIVVTLGIYSGLGNLLTPAKVFTALSLFNQLRFPLYFFPVTLSSLADGKVSVDRLTEFLGAEELVPYVRRFAPTTADGSAGATGTAGADAAAGGGVNGAGSDIAADVTISIKGGVFSWSDPEALALDAEAGGAAAGPGKGGLAAGVAPAAAAPATVPVEPPSSQPLPQQPALVTTAEGALPAPAGGGSGGVAAAADGLELPAPLAAAAAAAVAGSGRMRTTISPALHGIDLEVKSGSLVAVVGGVGSGKSSLLAALLGEMHPLTGTVAVAAGGMAYVPQSAWIPNDSLRNNICFGRPYDEKRYKEVVRVCRLERDLELLEFGDETEIGEQGINLSGGQKQRLSLARALFSGAEVYLLDDPLSALDAEVGKAVFEECIKGALGGKTRVLVTNQLQFLPQVDHIVVMGSLPGVEGSTIVDQGTSEELIARGRDLSMIVDDAKAEDAAGATAAAAAAGGPLSGADTAAGDAMQEANRLITDGCAEVTPAELAANAEGGARAADAGAGAGIGVGTGVPATADSGLTPSGAAPRGAAAAAAALAAHAAAGAPLGISSGALRSRLRRQIGLNGQPSSGEPNGWKKPAAGAGAGGGQAAPGAWAPGSFVSKESIHNRGGSAAASAQSGDAGKEAADAACFVCPPPEYSSDGGPAGAPPEPDRGILQRLPLTARLAAAASADGGGSASAGPSAGSADAGAAAGSAAAGAGSRSGGGSLIAAEERAVGAVGWPVYAAYLRAAGGAAALLGLMLLFFVSNAASQGQQWVVAGWTADPGYVKRPLAVYLAGVTGAAAAVALATHGRTLFAFWLGVRASRKLHGELLGRVLHAPTSFFDQTPVGRLVQRFSKDTDQIDQQLVPQISMLINGAMGMIAAVAAVIVATPPFAAAVAPLTFVYLGIMNRFRPVARELKRLDSLTRSPVYAHFGETLGGLALVRAFGHTARFARANERLSDANMAVYQALKVADRWLSVHLEMLGNVVVLAAATLAVFTASKGRLSAGLAGLALTNALSVTGLLSWAVRCFAETETMMNSVERILFVARETPQEAPQHVRRPRHPYYHQLAEVTGSALPGAVAVADGLAACPDDELLLRTGWPWEGGVTLRNVTMRYRPDTKVVLRGVDIAIRPGEKIGIVGRTGSGKSSLLQALFRMVEVESGSICIDGVDTRGVGLSALRSRLTIIPQEPVLFSGDLRGNLDPFGTYSDEEIWEALERASLAPVVRALPGGLSFPVAEYGANLSAGQRQLVCLARALLRRTRVLLLDEATAQVDYGTDAAIRAAIRSAFKDCTVLTVAHRLPTILDSDRILVMDRGQAAELDTPAALMARPDSQFARLLRAERESSGGAAAAPAVNGSSGQNGSLRETDMVLERDLAAAELAEEGVTHAGADAGAGEASGKGAHSSHVVGGALGKAEKALAVRGAEQ